MLKRTYLSLLFLTVLSLCAPGVSAQTGDAVGSMYATDITASIDGLSIPAYNIGGRTVIAMEDLEGYGFEVFYDDELRQISAYYYGINEFPEENQPAFEPPSATLAAQAGTKAPGQAVGKIYETDIQAFVNGKQVPSYNIGGYTAVCMEDLGALTGSPYADYGYSKYRMYCVWNADLRTISLHTFESMGYGSTKFFIEHPELGYDIGYDEAAWDGAGAEGRITLTKGSGKKGGMFVPYDGIRPYRLYFEGEPTDRIIAYRIDNNPIVFDTDALLRAYADGYVEIIPREVLAAQVKENTSVFHLEQELETDECIIIYGYYSGLPHGGYYKTLMLFKDGESTDLYAQSDALGFYDYDVENLTISADGKTLTFTRQDIDDNDVQFSVDLSGNTVELVG